MELTGVRRTIQGLMFLSVAWAGYLVLLTATWAGHGVSYSDPGSARWPEGYYTAGNLVSVFAAVVAIVLTGRALTRATPGRIRRVCWSLVALLPIGLFELAVQDFLVWGDGPDSVDNTPVAMLTRGAMAGITLSGVVLILGHAMLFAWERHATSRARLPVTQLRRECGGRR